MATTLAAAKAKLAAKIPRMDDNYVKAMSDFFGQDVSDSVPVKAYKAKVTPGMEDRWAKNLQRAFGL